MQSDPISGPPETAPRLLASLSAVVLAEGGVFDPAVLRSVSAGVADRSIDSETIVIANGVPDDRGMLVLRRLIAEIPDCTCFVIADPIDADAARIFGMEAAIGDHVLLLNGNALAEVAVAIPRVIGALREGFDLVIALPEGAARRSAGLIERAVYRLLAKLSGLALSPTASDLVAISREAVLHILSKPNAELLLKARTAGRGFPASTIADAYAAPPTPPAARRMRQRAAKALHLLLSIGALPVRVVSAVSLATSVFSVVYALYVVLVYLFNPDVASGWTTLSLQVSGMMFLVSLTLALLSEYVVQIHASTAVRRRRLVVRELRSEKTAHDKRLNVTDATGRLSFESTRAAPTGVDPRP